MSINPSVQNRSGFIQRERAGFHQIFAAAFAMCLIAATIDLFLPKRFRLLPQPSWGRKAFIDHVVDKAKDVTAFAFLN